MNYAADHLPVVDFDKEPDIAELIREFDGDAVLGALQAILGADAGMRDANGRWVLGRDSVAATVCIPVHGELEAIGQVCATADEDDVRGAARLVELLVRATLRYQKAAALHLHTVSEDFRELQNRHTALEESEARYRQLSQELEQRVQEQVRTLEMAQHQLYQAEKLRAVGQLAAGVAHEINNPLGFMKSNLTTAQSYVAKLTGFAKQMQDTADPIPARQMWAHAGMDEMLRDFGDLLTESIDGVARVARIVADLKGFSRVDRTGEDSVDVNEVIRSVCNVTLPQLGDQTKVSLDLSPLPLISGDAAALGQVLYNLLINAAEVMQWKGAVRITTHCANNNILVRVEDEGPGLAPEHYSRIFEPFYTTKPVGQGTGLGLSLSADIVHAHDGRIEVESRLDTGTVFTVSLPVETGLTRG